MTNTKLTSKYIHSSGKWQSTISIHLTKQNKLISINGSLIDKYLLGVFERDNVRCHQ